MSERSYERMFDADEIEDNEDGKGEKMNEERN